MSDQTPAHRTAFTARSGDTHVIGEDGQATNIDQVARESAAKAESKPRPGKRAADETNPAA